MNADKYEYVRVSPYSFGGHLHYPAHIAKSNKPALTITYMNLTYSTASNK
jgi:hypothetical protein